MFPIWLLMKNSIYAHLVLFARQKQQIGQWIQNLKLHTPTQQNKESRSLKQFQLSLGRYDKSNINIIGS